MTDDTTHTDGEEQRRRTPGRGIRPEASEIEPGAPEEFGLVQAWWGDGKGKTTAAMGMGFRAAGHGYRVHMLQFMKGGADSVEATRGEYNAIAAVPGFSYENTGHYGWHGFRDGSDDDDHTAKARGALERTHDLVEAANETELSSPIPLEDPPDKGMHMLIIDEILYAAARDLVEPEEVLELIEAKPTDLELVLTGSHKQPHYLEGHADLITNVRKNAHPFDEGYHARKGTEY